MRKKLKMRMFAIVTACALCLSGTGREPQLVYADTGDVEVEDVIFEEGYVSEDGKWDCTLVKHEYESDGEGRQIVEISIASYRETVQFGATEITIPEKMRVRRDETEDWSEEYYVTRIESMDPSSTTKLNVSRTTSVTLPQTVISIGSEAFSWMTSLEEVKISPDTDGEGAEQAVLESYWLNGADIGSSAFYKCEKLTSVEVPSVTREIGNNAFAKCERLQSINLPNGVARIGETAFAQCAFRQISLPESITEIGAGAFRDCDKLTAIEFPPELTELADSIVSGCEALTEITVPENVTAIGSSAFYLCLNLAEITFAEDAMIDTIGENAFKYCESLTGISLPDTVTEIGSHAFELCKSIRSMKLPEQLMEVPSYCFANCESLTSIVVPNSVEKIGKEAFYTCESLRTVVIPKNTEITYRDDAFLGCDWRALTIYTEEGSFVMENLDANTNFEFRCVPVHGAVSAVFDTEDGWRYMKDEVEGIKIVDYNGSLENLEIPEFPDAAVTSVSARILQDNTTIKSIQIPDTVTYIGADAFNGCTGLTKINIPSALEYIGDNALKDCQPMKDTRLPETIRYIGENSFCGWTELTKVVIPADVERLGENAFNGCTNLESVEFKGVSETNLESSFYIGDSAFQDCNLKSLTIPGNCVGMNNRAFAGNANLKTVVLPDDMYISDRAFADCAALESINLPSTLPNVGEYLFTGCKKLSGITIPEGVEMIDRGAFKDCTALAKVTIPSKDTKVKTGAFAGCPSLTIYTVSDSDALRYAKENSIPYVLLDGSGDNGGGNGGEGDNNKPDTSITCKKTVYSVTYGAKPFKINAASKGKLTFKSSSSKVAAVDKNAGTVTIKGTGVATITVKAGNNSVKVTVRVSPKKASLKSVKAAKGKKLTVKWAKDKNASGYQVQVSTDKNFKKNMKQKNVTKTSYTFPKLKAGKKYYVRVRSYKKSGKDTLYGAWSSKKQSGKVKK